MGNFLTPKTFYTRVTAGEFVYELIIAAGAIAAGVVTGLNFFNANPPNPKFGSLSFAVAGMVGITTVLRAFSRNRKANSETELHALDGVLHALHAILTANKAADHGLRMCVFVPKPNDGENVHQLTDYVGPDERHGCGRDLSCRCGIVGRAFRTGHSQFDKLENGSHVTDHLVAEHGFERREAATMRQDARAWAAIPIGEPERVVAVLFLDTAHRDFFGASNSICRSNLDAATLGIAKFVAAA